MSLDVYLTIPDAQVETGSGIYVRDNGQTREVSIEEWNAMHPSQEPIAVQREIGERTDTVFTWNITHNLTSMARKVGLYYPLWRPEEIQVKKAKDLTIFLTAGLESLRSKKEELIRDHSPENGWGTYEGLVEFVEAYLEACREHPEADIRVSR